LFKFSKTSANSKWKYRIHVCSYSNLRATYVLKKKYVRFKQIYRNVSGFKTSSAWVATAIVRWPNRVRRWRVRAAGRRLCCSWACWKYSSDPNATSRTRAAARWTGRCRTESTTSSWWAADREAAWWPVDLARWARFFPPKCIRLSRNRVADGENVRIVAEIHRRRHFLMDRTEAGMRFGGCQ